MFKKLLLLQLFTAFLTASVLSNNILMTILSLAFVVFTARDIAKALEEKK